MIPVSNDYRRQLIAGNRNYLIKVNMTLADGTALLLENEHIWDNGIVIDQATSSDSTFDIGAAIVGSLKVVIDNIKGNFSQYDFFDARLTLWLGVSGDVDEYDTQRYYRIGFYVVDEPNYNGSLITLNCLDNMTWFDTPFSDVGATFPTTAGALVADICSYVGVTLGTVTFPNYTTDIDNAPNENATCREVIQYVAQMCCCYCKIDTAGELVLKWYDKDSIIGITNYDGGTFSTTTTPYSDGCDLDGGHFNPWDGDNADGGTFQDLLNGVWISQNYNINVSTDNIVVTGCRVRNSSKDNAYDELWVDPNVEQDHERYVLVIDNNPFINVTNAADIANVVGSTLAGLPIRGYTATSLSDFSYETGDMATIIDFRGNRYYSWITHFTFTTNNSEQFSCGVESLKTRSEQRFSTAAETVNKANIAITEYDKAVKAMNSLAQSSIDYREYVYPVGATVGQSRTVWRYDGTSIDTTTPNDPKFPNDTTVVFKISGDGVFVSNSVNTTTGEVTYTNGYDANSGTAILNLIYAQGLNCDWIHAGTLTLGGNNNANGSLKILNSSGTQIGKWDKDGISATTGTFSGALSGATGSFNGNLTAGSATIGNVWYVNAQGLTNNSDSWVKPMEISCGKYGGTLIGMRGKTSGDHDGYLEVAVNDDDDYIHVHYNGITRKLGGSKTYAVWDGSDRRIKKNIKKLSYKEAKELISNVIPRKFEFKYESGYRYGFIAQELREILDDSCAVEYGEDFRAIHYGDFVAPLCVMVNKQQEEIDLLKKELAELKAKVK